MRIIDLACAIASFVSLFLISACVVPHPKSIKPMSISPVEYVVKSCEQLNTDQMTAWKRKEDLRIPLKRAAEDFPILGGTSGHAKNESEYSEMLGRLDAIEMAAFKNDCSIKSIDQLKAEYSLDGRTRPSWPSKT
jgi:hypothetical protein